MEEAVQTVERRLPAPDEMDRKTLLAGFAANALISYVHYVQQKPTPSEHERHRHLVSGSVFKRSQHLMT